MKSILVYESFEGPPQEVQSAVLGPGSVHPSLFVIDLTVVHFAGASRGGDRLYSRVNQRIIAIYRYFL